MKELRNATEKYFTDNHVKEVFTLDNLTMDRAKALRFCQFDEDEQQDLYLLPLWFVLFIPYGTKVISIGGEKFEYSKETDLDTRFGCVAFGIELKQ